MSLMNCTLMEKIKKMDNVCYLVSTLDRDETLNKEIARKLSSGRKTIYIGVMEQKFY